MLLVILTRERSDPVQLREVSCAEAGSKPVVGASVNVTQVLALLSGHLSLVWTTDMYSISDRIKRFCQPSC